MPRRTVSLPVQEDYGFVTVEAFASRKAVVTCTDSGGPAELVVDGTNGYVSEPNAARTRRRASVGCMTTPRWLSGWVTGHSRPVCN